jgi:regulator of sigma E protease
MIGVQTVVDEQAASDDAQLFVSAVMSDSPAAVIPAGSVIYSITTEEGIFEYPSPSEFSSIVSENGDKPVEVSYEFAGVSDTATLVPEQGLVESEPERYVIGASLLFIELQQQSFFAAIKNGFITTWDGLVAITTGLGSLLKQAVVGQADFSQVAGPVGIVGMVGDAASFGVTALLTFTAFISLNLAIINLLPFPALDGGRLVFVAIEAVTRKKIPPEWAGRINLVGFAILMLLMIAVTYNDVLRLL